MERLATGGLRLTDILFVFVREDKLPPGSTLMTFKANGEAASHEGEVPALVVLRDQLQAGDVEGLALPTDISAYGIEHSTVGMDVIEEFNKKNIRYKKLTSFSHVDGRPIYEKIKIIINTKADSKEREGAIKFFAELNSETIIFQVISEFAVLRQIVEFDKDNDFAKAQLELVYDNFPEFFIINENIEKGKSLASQIEEKLGKLANLEP